MEPAGRHALVTGGGRGIGAACARALTEAGAIVTVVGRTSATLAATVEAGGASSWQQADVTDPPSLAAAIGRAEALHGPLGILLNNAGAAESAPFGRTDRELWNRMLEVNLSAVYEACRLVLPGMIARGWGRVVTIASTAGLTGYAYVTAYVAAKHGVVGLTRALALEMARTGVTVNAVCPGYTETDLLAGSVALIADRTGRTEAEVLAGFAQRNPQHRLVRPDEVAAAVHYLCGPGSDAVTGQALAVAGGEVM